MNNICNISHARNVDSKIQFSLSKNSTSDRQVAKFDMWSTFEWIELLQLYI